MTFEEVKESYWKYYLSLEAQVCDLERFIEFDLENNGNTYSVRLLELLQAICSEIDVVGKTFATELDSSFVPTISTSILHWWFVVQSNNRGIQLDPVFFRKETLFPWEDFFLIKNKSCYKTDPGVLNSKVPKWWNSYNNVKHRRTAVGGNGLLNYTQANLSNVINALAGLFILEALLIEKVQGRVEGSKLFSCKGHNVFSYPMLW